MHDDDYRTLDQETPDAYAAIGGRSFEVVPPEPRSASRWWPRELEYRIGRALAADEAPPSESSSTGGSGVRALASAPARVAAAERLAARPRLGALRIRANLHTIVNVAQQRGVRVAFATQPVLWSAAMPPDLEDLLWLGGVGRFQVEPGRPYYAAAALEDAMAQYNETLLDVCRRREVPCVELHASLPKDTSVFYDDCHFNEPGARQGRAGDDAIAASRPRSVAPVESASAPLRALIPLLRSFLYPRSPETRRRHGLGLFDGTRVRGEARLGSRFREAGSGAARPGVPGEHALYDKTHPVHEKVLRPLQEKVRAQGLWACHLGPDLGGLGYGQLKLGLLNEILGRSAWAPSVFGCQAPDSGNAEILAHYGTDAQKEKYLEPLSKAASRRVIR